MWILVMEFLQLCSTDGHGPQLYNAKPELIKKITIRSINLIMKDLGKIIFHIPAREGSKRVPGKNLRKMNGKPMISYAIEALLGANISDNCYVNTDSKDIISYVNTNYASMKIYIREKELCNDNAQSDHFNADIINSYSDTLVMINPVCPLIESKDITDAPKCL